MDDLVRSKSAGEMSVTELKERHKAATETVNSLRERLKQKRLQLLDTDGQCEGHFILSNHSFALGGLIFGSV